MAGWGAVTKGEEKDSGEKGAPATPAEKIVPSLLHNQKRQRQCRTQAFSKTTPPTPAFALPPTVADHSSSAMAISYVMSLGPHTVRLRSRGLRETPGTGVTAPFVPWY